MTGHDPAGAVEIDTSKPYLTRMDDRHLAGRDSRPLDERGAAPHAQSRGGGPGGAPHREAGAGRAGGERARHRASSAAP